jgi:hypothetical protein
MGAVVLILGILVWRGVVRLTGWWRRSPGEGGTEDRLDSRMASIADEAQEWLRQHHG